MVSSVPPQLNVYERQEELIMLEHIRCNVLMQLVANPSRIRKEVAEATK